MKSSQMFGKSESRLRKAGLVVLGAAAFGWGASQPIHAATNLVVWDTGSRLGSAADLENRTGWKAVPSELFVFEADPPKAASDPGYYGREYSFAGDVVVENHSLTAVFRSAEGRVAIYAKAGVALAGGAATSVELLGAKIVELVPVQAKTHPASIARCGILRNAGDEVAIEVNYSPNGDANDSAVFSFGRNEIVEVKPAQKMKGFRLLSPIDYGVVPSFIGDDLIFDPADHASETALCVPSENFLLGLVRGENHALVVTWPKARQQVRFGLGNHQGQRAIESIDLDTDGQSFYLAVLGAPGIWHREELKASFLEKDVSISWKRPFPARWKTQLTEVDVKTTFTLRESKGEIWRGVPGSYNYPVWFDGDAATYHLSKKLPPKGQSIIYFLEGQDTPLSVTTPAEILRATLGRSTSEPILDLAGRKLRTHHRRAGDGVHRACTCGCTEAIQAIFEAGQELERKGYIQGALDDMAFFVRCHVERIDEYRRFAQDLIQFLRAQGTTSPELKPYLDELEQIVGQIPQEYNVQKENMKSPEYMDDLVRQTLALTGKTDPNNVKAYMELLKAWRGMGGAQDYVVAQCHGITRKLCQQAGYGCVAQPKAVAVAEEVRRRCRQCLRNPDGYEIWADY
jgi:hypothetical protein